MSSLPNETGSVPSTRAPKGRPTIIDTKSFVFWVLAVVLVYGGIHTYSAVTIGGTAFKVNPAVAWFGLIVWGLYAVAFLAFVYYHQLFVRRSPWITLVAFAWGGLVATYFAGEANSALNDLWTLWFGVDFTANYGTAISAATNEEALKTLGIVALALLPLVGVRSTLDGWFYGMMVGLGFSVVEDYLYTNQYAGDLGTVANYLWTRGLVNGLWTHAVYTGIVGAGIGYLVSRRDRPWWRRIGAAVGAFAIAWAFHFTWDSTYLGDLVGNEFLTFLVKSIPALLILLVVVRFAREHERKVWTVFVDGHIDRELVTEAEAKALLGRKSRRAARKEVRQAKGRQAGRLQQGLQYAQLGYIQAVDEEGADSKHAIEDATEIRELKAAIAAAAA